MKKSFCFAAAALLLAAAVSVGAANVADRILKTGEAVPELAAYCWVKGPKIELSELKGKKPVVLFFWTISQNGTKPFPLIAELSRRYSGMQFIGIGIDSPEAVRGYERLKELPFPVASDNEVETMRLYLRETDRIPMAAVINADGVLIWRGRVEQAEPVLEELRKGTFDLARMIAREKFSAEVMSAMKIRNFPRVLELLNSELKENPDNMELLSLKIQLLDSAFRKPAEALKTIDDALKRIPQTLALYELAVKICRENSSWQELASWYNRLIADFSSEPAVLLKFARMELNQPIESLRPDLAYKLSRAAYSAPKFTSDREKGVIAVTYAHALYYCGHPGKALELAKEGMRLLKNTPESESAKSYVIYYKNVLDFSKTIE